MKDPQRHIRIAYVKALKDKITLGGKIVKILDYVPEKEKGPYIVLSQQTATDSLSAKECTVFDTTILLDIVTSFDGDHGGKEHCDIISEQVLAIVVKKHASDLSMNIDPSFKIVTCRLEFSDYLQERISDNHHIMRKLLRIRNIIEEK